MTDYTKEAEELYPYKKYENLRKGIIYNTIIDSYREAHIAARQQSAAEIDRLRGEVRKLREGLGEVLKEYEYSCKLMAEANGMFWSENNVSISAKQLLTETEG